MLGLDFARTGFSCTCCPATHSASEVLVVHLHVVVLEVHVSTPWHMRQLGQWEAKQSQALKNTRHAAGAAYRVTTRPGGLLQQLQRTQRMHKGSTYPAPAAGGCSFLACTLSWMGLLLHAYISAVVQLAHQFPGWPIHDCLA
jgi:hypothetical protein